MTGNEEEKTPSLEEVLTHILSDWAHELQLSKFVRETERRIMWNSHLPQQSCSVAQKYDDL